MAKTSSAPTVASLLDKGNGILTKREGVWTYPDCPNDRSGTNLVLPIEFVSDAAVQDAIEKVDVVPKATGLLGNLIAVTRPPAEGETVRITNLAQAGTVEMATELPPNSRPTHDAGRNDKIAEEARARLQAEAADEPLPVGTVVPEPVVAKAAPVAPVVAAADKSKA